MVCGTKLLGSGILNIYIYIYVYRSTISSAHINAADCEWQTLQWNIFSCRPITNVAHAARLVWVDVSFGWCMRTRYISTACGNARESRRHGINSSMSVRVTATVWRNSLHHITGVFCKPKHRNVTLQLTISVAFITITRYVIYDRHNSKYVNIFDYLIVILLQQRQSRRPITTPFQQLTTKIITHFSNVNCTIPFSGRVYGA